MSGPDASAVDVAALHAAQVRFFEAGHTLSRAFREEQLRAFLSAIQKREADIEAALAADLRRSQFEAWGLETSVLYAETKHAIAHLAKWMRPRRKIAPLVTMPSWSTVHPQPLGPSLILGAWNYPVQLSLAPVIGAIAAGCTAVVKPSELSTHSSALIVRILRETFSPEYIAGVEGGVDTSRSLLELPWEHFFYTGGTTVGKIVAHAAAEHLARCTLELGGKSPVIVGPSANLETAARRIAWGKWMNAGQTCVAPDYVLVADSVHDALVDQLRRAVRSMYGDDPQKSPDLCRMVNDRHFERVKRLIEPARVAFGGASDASDRYIEPTVLTGVTWDDAVMREEIFGPVLPILKIGAVSDAIAQVRRAPNPLALYLFTEDQADVDLVVQRISFGGGCVNNCTLHLSDPDLPFGGIRGSGLGAYHGKASFDAFSHHKAVLESSGASLFDLPLKYPPYAGKLSKVKWILG
jgi:aldehyde dehydrogenase (NAD+)